MVYEQEAWQQRMAWQSKPLLDIRLELLHVSGKHARLCNEASRRLEQLQDKLKEIRAIAVSDSTTEEKLARITAKIDGVIGG